MAGEVTVRRARTGQERLGTDIVRLIVPHAMKIIRHEAKVVHPKLHGYQIKVLQTPI